MELKSSEITSQKYHDIFDYKLTNEEAFKWQYQAQKVIISGTKNKSRLQREKYSQKKLIIARKAANLIAKIPTVKFVGITGALAMNNAGRNSDIDLMIITKNGCLWTTRLISYLLTWLFGFKTRRPKNRLEKDKLCLNMWLDESSLVWDKKDRNIYTSHEIAQVIPLINKDKTYEKFLFANKWILKFWPNAVKVENSVRLSNFKSNRSLIEKIAYELQYFYMKSKITREVVTHTRAVFHPNDWGKVVMEKLNNK